VGASPPIHGETTIRNLIFIMAVKVIISRRVPSALSANLRPLLLKLRALAGAQPGYISGETLVNVQDHDDVMVLSTWNTIEQWTTWKSDPRRVEIENAIDSMLGEPARYGTYFYG
jgi:heme oxygenase (mycobilin-producing)